MQLYSYVISQILEYLRSHIIAIHQNRKYSYACSSYSYLHKVCCKELVPMDKGIAMGLVLCGFHYPYLLKVW